MNISRTLLLLWLALSPAWASAKDFSFIDIQGKAQRLADYRGKWVLVNFWSTKCQPCEQEAPELVELHNAHKNSDMVVIGIALESSSKTAPVTEYAARNKISYPLILGTFTKVEEQLPYAQALPASVKELPATIIFNPAGEFVTYQKGAVTSVDIEAFLLATSKKK